MVRKAIIKNNFIIKEKYSNYMHEITVFGDSITFGRGSQPEKGWCDKLKDYFETKDYYNCLFNLGIPGDTSKGLLRRFDAEASARITFKREEDRQIIIIAIGINDSRLNKGIAETEKDEFQNNIRELIEKAKKYTKEIVFIGLTPVDEEKTLDYEGTTFTNKRIIEYNHIIRDNCLKENIHYINIIETLLKIDYKELLDDGLHPNDKGYEKIFIIIKDFLEKNNMLS